MMERSSMWREAPDISAGTLEDMAAKYGYSGDKSKQFRFEIRKAIEKARRLAQDSGHVKCDG